MNVNKISEVTFKGISKPQELKKQEIIPQTQTNPINEAPMPSPELMRVMKGVTVHRPVPIKYTPQKAEQYLNNHPASQDLFGKDRDNIIKVMCRGNEQSANVEMQLDLVDSGDLEPSTLSNYWSSGKMCDNLAKDIDMVYEAHKAGKSVNDIYVPTVKSKEEGNKSTQLGDVFKVQNEDKIYVKVDEKESRQLNMDKDMFVKLFPPAKRFTTQQQSIGDCYLVSTLNTLMENPKSRVALYEAFNQDGKDVTVKFNKGFGEYKYPNAQLPSNRVSKYSLQGSTGVRILEDAYGLDSINKADSDFKRIMTDKINEKEAQLAKATPEEKTEISDSLQAHKMRLADYQKAKADPNRKIVVSRNDNYFNIYYEEDKNGLVFKDLMKDPDNKQDHFKSPADFYRGSLGGYNFEVMQRFGFGGFRQMNLNFEADDVKKLMVKKDFNKNYIMTGGTRADGESRKENPVATQSGVYGFHAYTLEPQVDNKGDLKVRCTNPWNTSYDADISYADFLKYYDSVSVVDVNSYGKNLPLEKQPVPYDEKGAVLDGDKNRKPVIWYKNGPKVKINLNK